MTSLAEVTLQLRHHKAALWWLGMLFQQTDKFEEELSSIALFRVMSVVFILYLHFLPYLLGLIIVIRCLVFWIFGSKAIALMVLTNTDTSGLLLWYGKSIIYGIIGGILIGIYVGILSFWFIKRNGMLLGLAFALIVGGIFGATLEITYPLGKTQVLSFLTLALPALYYYASFALFILLFNFPAYLLCIYPQLNPKLCFRKRSISTLFFDILIIYDVLPRFLTPKLDQLLSSYLELDFKAGSFELERIINFFPSHRNAAFNAQIRSIAINAGRETKFFRLDNIVESLPEGEDGFLAYTPKLKIEVAEIASLQRRLDTQTRPFLKETEAELLVEKIHNFQSRVSGYPEPLGSEFRQAAGKWLAIAKAQYQGLRQNLEREPQPQVFRAGDPVNREQEAFIPRLEVLGELDRQLSLATGCPGLVLYGRRRMGKSTLLKNLDDFLPVSVNVAVVSMQNPQAFTSLTAWLALVSAAVRAILSENQRPAVPETLADFFALLTACNEHLQTENKRLLLAIDEYEYLDSKIGEGVFPEDLLHTLRESIQNHRRIVWLFAGSHGIEELSHAPWSSYLISARTLEVPAFTAAETRLLLTEPMRQSRLWENNEAARPRFAADFWGANGIDRIHAETAGWPHLVQLLAETAVDLCNERQCQAISVELLEQAISKAVISGDTVLRQLLRGESTEADWAWLLGLRRRDSLPIPDDEAVYQSLRRRWLVVDADNGEWRLRVPLLLRWLRERG